MARHPILKYAGVPCPACKGLMIPLNKIVTRVCKICGGAGRVIGICREHPLRVPRCPGCQARLGGLVKTPALTKARQINGRLGGRPKKKRPVAIV